MNIFSIAMKEIKGDFRDIRTFVFMLAFPLILMLILGTALTNTFDTNIQMDDMNVLYQDQTNGEVSQGFDQFINVAEKSGIHFKKAGGNEDGKDEVKENNYDGYMEITQNGIQLYLNERNSIGGSILQGMLTAFVDQYNIAQEVAKVAPDKLEAVLSAEKQDDYIQESSLSPNSQPGSIDYYAVVMTTMIAMYGALSASSLILKERARKTGDRLLVSPVRKSEIFIGKVLGNIVINTICVSVVILCSGLFFKANWGDHLGVVFFVLLTEIVFAVSLGLGISYLTKTNAASQTIILLFVQLASFFGGAYFRLDNPEGILKFVADLSPLTWINTAIMKIIYTNDLLAAIPAAALNIGLAIVLLLVAVVSMQRREGL